MSILEAVHEDFCIPERVMSWASSPLIAAKPRHVFPMTLGWEPTISNSSLVWLSQSVCKYFLAHKAQKVSYSWSRQVHKFSLDGPSVYLYYRHIPCIDMLGVVVWAVNIPAEAEPAQISQTDSLYKAPAELEHRFPVVGLKALSIIFFPLLF